MKKPKELLKTDSLQMVQFDNGKYGIKRLRGFWQGEYYDLDLFFRGDYSWPIGSVYMTSAQASYWWTKLAFKKISKRFVQEV